MSNYFSVEVRNISKIFSAGFNNKTVHALDDISFNVEKGIIFGLLGQNGAGKTTLIKILLGLTIPTTGSFQILGESISANLRKQIGYLPENIKFPEHLKGTEALKIFGKIYGLEGVHLQKRIDEVLDLVQMRENAGRKVKTYSKGMQQRLGLAQAMLHEPELLILDEPTDGMDPVGRKQVRDALLHLKDQGKTIFINSHILSEVELITDNLLILNKGKIVKDGTIKELTEKAEEYRIVVDSLSYEQFAAITPFAISVTRINENSIRVSVKDFTQLNALIDNLRRLGVLIEEIIKIKQSLEQAYLSFIQPEKGK